ncbi:unnamed protein product [Lasius platythorax]|uniref:Uncharacterized protein n=1 Tax=Lasius platythorax TaxID=488582 RepID=A0AAV2NGM2_9HYME
MTLSRCRITKILGEDSPRDLHRRVSAKSRVREKCRSPEKLENAALSQVLSGRRVVGPILCPLSPSKGLPIKNLVSYLTAVRPHAFRAYERDDPHCDGGALIRRANKKSWHRHNEKLVMRDHCCEAARTIGFIPR